MSCQKIEQLTELLTEFLGPKKTITNHETTRLTATGENYGSTILSLKVFVKDGEEKDEMIEAVAKLPPPGEFIQRMFNIPVTFRNEINFYKIIVPEFKKFLKEKCVENDLDCYPRFYGGRLSLSDNKDYADDDAVLLLENLKLTGYTVIERTVGFDLKSAKVVLKALAQLHAIPLAMKLLDPKMFDKKIKSLFTPYVVFPMDDKMLNGIIDNIRKLIESIEECKHHAAKVENVLRASTQFNLPNRNSPDYMREPFATIIHTDAWVNNFMIKFVNGEPTDCKLVDFQLYEYGSPARDLVFFIFTSVQLPVLQKHYDELIEFYHKNVTDILKMLKCDTSPFSMEALQKEIKQVSKECEFFHSVMMLTPIFATKDSVKELDEYKEEDMTKEMEVPPKHKERAAFIVKEFIRKNYV